MPEENKYTYEKVNVFFATWSLVFIYVYFDSSFAIYVYQVSHS